MKLALDPQSAQALRMLSAALKQTINEISNDTAKLLTVAQALDGTLGPHKQAFYDMLLSVKLAQDLAANAVLVLAPKMENTASKIENYLSWRNTLTKEQLVALKKSIRDNGPAVLASLGFGDTDPDTGTSSERARKLTL